MPLAGDRRRQRCSAPKLRLASELSMHAGRNPAGVLNNKRDGCLDVRNFVPIIFVGWTFLSCLLETTYKSSSRLAWKVR